MRVYNETYWILLIEFLKCYLLCLIKGVENFILNNFLPQVSNKKSEFNANKLYIF